MFRDFQRFYKIIIPFWYKGFVQYEFNAMVIIYIIYYINAECVTREWRSKYVRNSILYH